MLKDRTRPESSQEASKLAEKKRFLENRIERFIVKADHLVYSNFQLGERFANQINRDYESGLKQGIKFTEFIQRYVKLVNSLYKNRKKELKRDSELETIS
tara:strand:+ start:802 stop:1101 length:300 start_codon:yes stop_codon:yes gene_type:complete